MPDAPRGAERETTMSVQEAETENRISAEDEEQILDSIRKWLERDVRPHVKKFD